MLFKALVRRLNGGTDTGSSRASSSHRTFSTKVYNKYPNLPDLVLRLLQPMDSPVKNRIGHTNEIPSIISLTQAQRVFPALEIIERSGMPSQHRMGIKEAIWYHMESPVWSIREKAAKALSCVLDDNDRSTEIKALLQINWWSQNALHGKLLYLRCILSSGKTPPSKRSLGK